MVKNGEWWEKIDTEQYQILVLWDDLNFEIQISFDELVWDFF